MISEFVDSLGKCLCFNNVENQYASSFKYYEITKNNLTQYLKSMYLLKPKIILVGEAPGYNGCRWSGVPFTSENNITAEYFNDLLFGFKNGFKVRDINHVQKEASATIVWNVLKGFNKLPLMWNAFPFHPYRDDNLESNRTPIKVELDYGKQKLEEIIKIFSIEKIIAVGSIAYETLQKMNIKCNKIRHPANGGKREFIEGIKREM